MSEIVAHEMKTDRADRRRTSVAILLLICPLLLVAFPYLHFQWQLARHTQDPDQLLPLASSPAVNYLVHELSENEYAWTNVLNGIKTGDQRWLRLANALVVSRSAHPTEELYGALSVALDKTPEIVLFLPNVNPEIVCAFIEDDHGGATSPDFNAIYKHREAIVSKINVPALATRKAECLESAKHLLQH